jgi:hypothetical protein
MLKLINLPLGIGKQYNQKVVSEAEPYYLPLLVLLSDFKPTLSILVRHTFQQVYIM